MISEFVHEIAFRILKENLKIKCKGVSKTCKSYLFLKIKTHRLICEMAWTIRFECGFSVIQCADNAAWTCELLMLNMLPIIHLREQY